MGPKWLITRPLYFTFQNTMISNTMKRIKARISRLLRQNRSRIPSEIAEFDTIEGFLSPREAATLYCYATKVKPNGTIVEIGSWKGKSTFCLARGLRGGKVSAIDPFNASGDPGAVDIYKRQKGEKDLLAQFKERMSQLGVSDKIDILQGYSADFRDKFKSIDLLFIDGDHSIEGCKCDFDLFAHLIAPGGYILFHDYDPMRSTLGPTWVVNNLIENKNNFRNVEIADSMWVGQRSSAKW